MTGTNRNFIRLSGLGKAAIWLMLMVAVSAHAQSGTWATMTPMPTARAYATTGVVGSQLYVVTGAGTSANEVYDATTDTWAGKAPIPTNRSSASTGVIGGKLYVVGGCINADCRIGYTGTLEVYDPGNNTWIGKTPMPTPRSSTAVGVIAGKLYVAGGFGMCGPCTGINTLEVYDPTTDTWATKAPMPTSRSQMGAAVINGKLYVVGGDNSANNGVLATLEVYDPVANAWTTKTSMPTAREGVGVSTVGNLLYAISGYDGSSSVNTVEAYDSSANVWSTPLAPIPTARTEPQPQNISGILYVAGNGAASAISTLEAFIPPPIQVDLDIRPNTDANNISLKTGGDLPVAILSSANFDAPAMVDTTSLTFGHAGTENSLISCNAKSQDVNGDKLKDLVCHFDIKSVGFQLGDTLGYLKGATTVGNTIQGSDPVKVSK